MLNIHCIRETTECANVIFCCLSSVSYPEHQSGKSWQPFGEHKNGPKIHFQARICYFRDKCVFFANLCQYIWEPVKNYLADFVR